MTFFNKKEEVLAIELTPRGRQLLSQGKLKPVYYSFLDDDILYDSGNGGFSETNAQTKVRILTETPYLKPQTNYKGIDASVDNMEDVRENTQFLQEVIGTSDPAAKATPAWNVTFLHGEVSSSTNQLSSPSASLMQIPQINSTIEFTMTVDNVDNNGSSADGLLFSRQIPSAVKPDGTFIRIDEEQVLMSILETNGFIYKDSFEIEVYLYEQDENSLEKQLKFFEQDIRIENDMLIEEERNDQEITPDFVEYYLDLQVDRTIPEEDICSGTKELEQKNIFLDLEINCPDRDDMEVNFYGSQVSPDDLEEC